ncbi:MAG: HlyC/CorC family transporter [Spirochaetales bacterium]|nr:MAG: HlyC/CorC family transporter [Spirochaetales bacterium]
MIILQVTACILLAAFFAGLETGLISANQFALYAAKEKGVFYARAADFLLLKPERLLSTTLIGTNFSVVTATVILSRTLRETHIPWAPWVGSIVLAVVMLLISEIIPKSFFRQHADTISVRLAPALVFFYFIFYPVATVLNIVVKFILLVTGQLKSSNQGVTSKQSLRLLVRLGGREAGLSLADQRVIDDIFDFQDTMAREVMVQIHRTLACPDTLPIEDLARQALAARVRFVPVYQNRLDNTVGYVDVEEVATVAELSLKALMRPAVFYPDTKRIPELLLDMNRRRLRVVFLSNEYGRVSGIITPDEIVAEIAGNSPGAVNPRSGDITKIPDGGYLVAGIADVEDFRNETGVPLPVGPYDTVGGFLLAQLGRIPEAGERYEHQGASFVIKDRDELHIKRMTVVPATHHRER